MNVLPPYFVFAALAVFAVILYADARHGLVHVPFTLAAAAVLSVWAGVSGIHSWQSMAGASATAGGFFLLQYAVSRGKWIGAGDVYIGVCMGAVLGWPLVLPGLLISYCVGAATAGVLILSGKKKMADTLPLGVFLAVGTAVALVFGEFIIHWYISFL